MGNTIYRSGCEAARGSLRSNNRMIKASLLALLLSALALSACGNGNSGGNPGPGPGPGDSDWSVSTLDSSGSVGQGASLAIIGGLPAISYSDATNFGARYIRAANAAGTSWGSPVQAASGSFVATGSTSLAVVDGRPAIAFQRGNVKFVRAADSSGSSWGSFASVGSTNGRNSINLVDLDAGPAVVFRDPNIELVLAVDSAGAAWPTTAQQLAPASRPVSAALVDGRLAIAYTTGIDQLAYRIASDGAAEDWENQVIVDSRQLTSFQPALAVVDGRPAIAYVNNAQLVYVRAADSTGSQWTAAPQLLANTADPNGQTDLAVVGGRPAAAFSRFSGIVRELCHVAANDSAGASWGSVEVVDDSGSAGASLSLAEVAGKPAIAYYDANGANLKYARGRAFN